MDITKEALELGTSVKIKRSDGRIHDAEISKLDDKTQSVDVQWSENGLTKCKQFQIGIIRELNPNLFKIQPINKTPLNTRHSTTCLPIKNNRIPRSSIMNKVLEVENIPPTVSKIAVRKSFSSSDKFKKPRQTMVQAKSDVLKMPDIKFKPRNPQFNYMIQEYRSNIEYKPLKDYEIIENRQITVCVRKRPLNKKELNQNEIDVITVPNKDTILVHEPKNKVDLTKYLENQQFRFDFAFDENVTNELVYKYTAKPLVETIFEGEMATCFAYGQTGSGKTHTMGGSFSGKHQDSTQGIYAMVAKDVFEMAQKYDNLIVTSSFFEIYGGKVFDLLDGKNELRILEDGKQQVQVVNLSKKVVTTVEQVLKIIDLGNKTRTSGQTSANLNSSRSHAVFQITLWNNSHEIHGKLSLIDLAGSERGADTKTSDRITRMEGAEINKSLLALKECIRALGRKGAHLPFRGSKLTQVLRDSFIGENSKTCMIAMISPGLQSCEHSLNTLRYADRVKELVTDSTQTDNQNIFVQNDISELQILEEDVINTFQNWRQKSKIWETQEMQLFSMVKQVDYDQDVFSYELENVLVEKQDYLQKLMDKLASFKNLLAK